MMVNFCTKSSFIWLVLRHRPPDIRLRYLNVPTLMFEEVGSQLTSDKSQGPANPLGLTWGHTGTTNGNGPSSDSRTVSMFILLQCCVYCVTDSTRAEVAQFLASLINHSVPLISPSPLTAYASTTKRMYCQISFVRSQLNVCYVKCTVCI